MINMQWIVWLCLAAWVISWAVLYFTIEEVEAPTTESEVLDVDDDPEQYCCQECAVERFSEFMR